MAGTLDRYDIKTLHLTGLAKCVSMVADTVRRIVPVAAQQAAMGEMEVDTPPAPDAAEYERIGPGSRKDSAGPYFVVLVLVTVLLSVWAGFCI